MKTLEKKFKDETVRIEMYSKGKRRTVTYNLGEYGDTVSIIYNNEVYKVKEWEADLVQNYGADINEL